MLLQKWAVTSALLLGIWAGQAVTSKPPEPESIGAFFYLDSAAQTLKPLPVEAYKHHLGGHFTLSDTVVVSGNGSSFRIAATNEADFIFKSEHPEDARLFQFTVKDKRRQ